MATPKVSILGKLFPLLPILTKGRSKLLENTADDLGPMHLAFVVATGTTDIPNLTYNQASDVTLIADTEIPTGKSLFIKRLTLKVLGGTAWTNGTAIEIKTSDGQIVAAFPLSSLKANASFQFPANKADIPITVTVTGGASTTTVVNLASTPFVAKATNTLVGQYVKCVSGTAANIGQVRRITDHDTQSMTLHAALPAAPAASDTFEVYAHQGVATMNTTTVTANDALTSSAMIGKWVNLIAGTGAGQARQVTANTNSAMTVGTLVTAGDTTTKFTITDVPDLSGASSFGNMGGCDALAAGKGLIASVVGTMGAGSPVSLCIEGYMA